MPDLRGVYRNSDQQATLATVVLLVVGAVAMFTMVYTSPSLVAAIVFAVAFLILAFLRPTWALAGFLLYLPFEPFLLKWVPDDVYVYARYFSEIIVYLLVASTIWKRITKQLTFKQTPLDIPFILFVIIALTSALINFVPIFDALMGVRQIVRFILLFFVTVYLAPSERWIKTVLYSLFAVLAIQVVIGYAQFLFGETLDTFLLPSEVRSFGEITLTSGTVQFWDFGQRIFATMGRYDRLGTFMAFLFLIIVSLLYEPRLKKYRGRISALLILALPALAMTYSRSSWFGFLLGFLFIGLWAKRDKRVAWALGGAVGVIAVYLAVTGLVINNLIDVADQSVVERFFEAFSYERWRGEYYGLGRLYWIVQTLLTVVPAAIIFGHGPGMYGGGAVSALGNTDVYDNLGLPFGVYGTEGYIDNNWFSLWGETGTIGLAVYLWMFIALFLLCVRVWRRSKHAFTRALALGVAAAMLAVALNAFLATFLEVRTLASYLWVFGGIVVVMGQREELLE